MTEVANPMTESTAVALANINGKMDVVLTKLDHQGAQLSDGSASFKAHGDRIDALESFRDTYVGERKGIEMVVRVLYAIMALFGVGLITIIIRVFTSGQPPV